MAARLVWVHLQSIRCVPPGPDRYLRSAGGRMGSSDTPEVAQRSDSAASLLSRICAVCVSSLPVTGAAVSVMTPGGHRGVACTPDETARALEDLQFTLGAGPGPTAFDTGTTCFVPDLGTDGTRGDWVAFRAAALELGVQAIFAFPLHLGAASLGVLTLSRTEPGALNSGDLAR